MAASAKKGRVVKAPLVIAKAANGSDVYLYQGTAFPEDGLADGEAKRLEEFLDDADA
jgi:hypothetical protein